MLNELEETKWILDDNESVLLSFKPNRKRFVNIGVIFGTLSITLFTGIFLLIGILGLLDVIKFTNESGARDLSAPIGFIAFGSLPFVLALVAILGTFRRYKNSLYVVTNKRLVIRSGFIGVDYKTLEHKNIIAMDVRVDFLDKFVLPNTGTIIFASAANPMIQDRNNRQTTFMFAHIDDPYNNYKKVKQLIDENSK